MAIKHKSIQEIKCIQKNQFIPKPPEMDRGAKYKCHKYFFLKKKTFIQ